MHFGLRLFIGMLSGAVVGFVAYRARSLTVGGAVAATVMGTAAVAAGWAWAAILILYFVSSSVLSRFGRERKQQRTAGIIEKQGPRDSKQVLANGLIFLIASTAATYEPGHAEVWMAIGAGSLAASAADTWATEVGTLVGQTPRSIFGGRPMRVGESGGISPAGSLASVGGSVFVAAVVVIAGMPTDLGVAVAAGGLTGALADSLIGATVQQRRWCDACESTTEMFIHKCGTRTRHVGGMTFLENDAVNFMANAIGACTAALLFVIMS